MNIQERNVTKQEALNVLLEEIYLYLRYGEIERAFDALDEAINENKNHYEYLVEKIKLLYMLYLKEEAYEVLDANIELLYNNIDKIDVDFISRRIYYHFYRNTELDATNNTTGNFDYLKITKEFINKYGFNEQNNQEDYLPETAEPESTDINTAEGENSAEPFFSNDNLNLFGEPTILEEVLDEIEVPLSDEVVVIFEPVVDEVNIFEEIFPEQSTAVNKVVDEKEIENEVFSETVVTDFVSEVVDEITEDEKFEPEIINDVAEDNDFEPETIDDMIEDEELGPETITELIDEETKVEIVGDDTVLESIEQEMFSEPIIENPEPMLEKIDEADIENEFPENQEAPEILSTEDVEEVITGQDPIEEEDIIIEDNPDIDVPIYLGRVNGKDVFLESMADHSATAKEEKPIIIIDSSQYTFARLASLLVLGFVIGATIVYYL